MRTLPAFLALVVTAAQATAISTHPQVVEAALLILGNVLEIFPLEVSGTLLGAVNIDFTVAVVALASFSFALPLSFALAFALGIGGAGRSAWSNWCVAPVSGYRVPSLLSCAAPALYPARPARATLC